MASLVSLKSELKLAKETFTKKHERFQISQAATDQLTCRFIGENGKKYDIHATIPDCYPSDPLIWYTDCEEANIMEIVEKLSERSKNEHILKQVNILLRELCGLHKIEMPKEAATLMYGESSVAESLEDFGTPEIDKLIHDDDDDTFEEVELDDDVFDTSGEVDNQVQNYIAGSDDNDLPLKESHLKLFKKINTDPSSNAATKRLMKEIREIYRAESYKNGDFTFEIDGDSIYSWNIELMAQCIDNESALYQDLLKLKEENGKDSIVLNMTFNDKYPLEPPFVRIVSPNIMCKHVVGGGAICTELLLKQCWSPAYTIESVIIQMAALFVKGSARIDFKPYQKYSLAAAKRGFTEVTEAKKSGWFDGFTESS